MHERACTRPPRRGSSEPRTATGPGSPPPHLLAAGDLGSWAWAARLGYAFRSGRVADVTFADELRYAASAGVRLAEKKLLLGPELHGTFDVGKSAGEARGAGLEVDLGAHYALTPEWRVALGFGSGLTRSAGVPNFRALASIGWMPALVAEAPQALPPADRDGDGAPDARDLCPDVPAGAHPDPDQPGCPDEDSDGDGLLDHDDECPAVPAGPRPDPRSPGCPATDGDGDGDGVPDSVDVCPKTPAGPHPDPRWPGCPLPDRDDDGIPDALDLCPDQPGAPSADARRNGCRGLVEIKGDKIVILEPVHFAANEDVILESGRPVLEAVAGVLQASPQFRRVSVAGHTDARGPAAWNQDLSERRARSVVAWLVENGIAADRLEAHGFGPSQPIADNGTPAGRAANRRVEFHILRREASGD